MRIRQAWTIARIELRRAFFAKRALWVYALALLPALAFFGHGVVLEPHLQNVLVCVDGDGRPVQAVFRDLEGTKLVSSRHGALLDSLPPGVARGLSYDTRRGWDRVAYCLLVNHLAEVAAAIADRCGPGADYERELWRQARQVLTEAAAEHGWPLAKWDCWKKATRF